MSVTGKICILLVACVGGLMGLSAEFSTYALLKEADVPEYMECRLSVTSSSYTLENYGWGDIPDGTSWHETVFNLTWEWGFWTFAMGDLNIGGRLPFYFWYAKDELRSTNELVPGAKIKVTGFMDPEVFADFKFKITDHINGLLHAGTLIPGLAEPADEGGGALGVARITAMGGVIIEYNRFVARLMAGIESGKTPDVMTDHAVPAFVVPQVSAWDNSSVPILDLTAIFCTSATSGFGLQYLYKGSYFDAGAWVNDTGPDNLGMLVLTFYFANTAGGFYASEAGSIFSLGVGMGGINADPDLNPDILYRLTFSRYY